MGSCSGQSEKYLNNADSGLFSKSTYVEFGAFWYQICRGSKNFAFGLMAGKFGKFGLKALFVSCAFIVRIAAGES